MIEGFVDDPTATFRLKHPPNGPSNVKSNFA